MKKRILVLGASFTGGDWPPVACLARGLHDRGHELRCFADSAIRTDMQQVPIPFVLPPPELEMKAYMARIAPRFAGLSDEQVLELLEQDSSITAWSKEILPHARALAERFHPHLILSQLFCLRQIRKLLTTSSVSTFSIPRSNSW